MKIKIYPTVEKVPASGLEMEELSVTLKSIGMPPTKAAETLIQGCKVQRDRFTGKLYLTQYNN
jgi:hypothetical protein